MKYQFQYTITYSDVDASRHLRLCDLQRYLLEAAGNSAQRLGLGTNYLVDTYNSTWVLTRMTVQMDYLPSYNDTLLIETWIEGNAHMLSIRNFRLYLMKQNEPLLIGQATSVWTLLNLTTRQVDVAAFADKAWEGAIDGERLTFARSPRLGKIELPEKVMQHTIHYTDLDYNNHCNSIKYLQFMLNACDDLTAIWPVRLDINYAKEVHKNDTVHIQVHQSEDQVQYCILNPENEVSCTALIQKLKE